jgi:hypothetical protein
MQTFRHSFMAVFMLLMGASNLAGGCAKFSTQRGVENLWSASDAPVFESGSTTQSDVLKALGPPSQIIALGSGSVFYYLVEKGSGKGLILIVYNDVRANVKYERAIFFFDDKGVLTEYTYSKQDPPSQESKESEDAD